MAELQHSTGSDTDQHQDVAASGRPRLGGGIAPWGDGLRMIAVTTERLATATGTAAAAGYLPTVPADSEEPVLDQRPAELKRAVTSGTAVAVIIGPQERERGELTVRDLRDGAQLTVAEDDTGTAVARILSA